MSLSIPWYRRFPRLVTWSAAAAVLCMAIWLIAPQQLPVALYKLTLVAVAVVLAYWLDRALFPYARPDSYLKYDWRYGTDEPQGAADFEVVDGYQQVFAAAQLRRAVVVAAVVLAVALGL
ncbi:putative holin [Chitiniphilus shinanonensis]|uniref:putative holin n=1 Tax=Chitiniphilus shinanonensis TaxID=553088 RepID=UPI0030449B1E